MGNFFLDRQYDSWTRVTNHYFYLENLPSGENYEKSFMHRDVVTHVMVTPTDFIITASCDGHIKFWKKLEACGISKFSSLLSIFIGF